jgi:hypothetical protein
MAGTARAIRSRESESDNETVSMVRNELQSFKYNDLKEIIRNAVLEAIQE